MIETAKSLCKMLRSAPASTLVVISTNRGLPFTIQNTGDEIIINPDKDARAMSSGELATWLMKHRKHNRLLRMSSPHNGNFGITSVLYDGIKFYINSTAMGVFMPPERKHE